MTTSIRCLAIAAFAAVLAASDGPVLVVNAGSAVKDLPLQTAIDILNGERKELEGGGRATLIMPRDGSPEMAALLAKVFKTDSDGLKKHWTELVFQNRISAAPRAASSRVAAKIVEEDPNAIAVIAGKDLTAAVRAVTVDGKGPDDPAYFLKP